MIDGKQDEQTILRPKGVNRTLFPALAMVLGLLSGCATGGGTEPKPESTAADVRGDQEPTVTRLQEAGQEGFIIREPADLDADSRESFGRAVALLNEGTFDQAAALLEPIVESGPAVTAPYVNLALAYVQLNRQDEAEKHLRTALALLPGHPVAANTFGLMLRREGRFEEARAVYEGSLERFPEYLPARRNLGILCELYLDDPACALEQYETYFAAMPQDEEVGIWIAGLRLRLERGGG